MNISYKWLRELLPTNLTPKEVADRLTSIGLETGSIEEVQSIEGGLKGLVIGEVLKVEEHPNSDHLHITKVSIGNESEPLQIVCGAPNVAKGKAVVVATIGTELGSGEDKFTIKKSKIRGVESFGMLCSEVEIGVGEDNSGIILIDLDKVKIGIPASEYYNLESDYSLEVDITPNRNDATSHYGVARDLAAHLSVESGEKVKAELPEVKRREKGNAPIEIEVTDKDLCPRFMGVVIRGVKVAESPEWIKKRLAVIGVNSINNIVDITNYVLHEVGQPMHCYDLKNIGNKLTITTPRSSTNVVTLDDEQRELLPKDITIHSENGDVVCIAGVMGAKNSGVTNDTTDILLEVANFNPTSVRKTARRLGINTDSSFRFERGLDANACEYAIFRAIDLIIEYASGEIDGCVYDYYPVKQEPFRVNLSLDKMYKLVGQEIPEYIILNILSSLEIDITARDSNFLELSVPRYRVDVQRDVDVIEDVMRVYGYNKIGLSGYINANLSSKTLADKSYNRSIIISQELVGAGYNEILCNSLSSSVFYDGLDSYPAKLLVRLLNPLSAELDVMRQTLLFGGLQSISRNLRRQQKSFYFFEWGNVASLKNYNANIDTDKPLKNYVETPILSILTAGLRINNSWAEVNKEVSAFEIKATVINILDRLGIGKDQRVETMAEWDIFSGKCLEISVVKGSVLCRIGKVKNSILKAFDIDIDVYYAEMNWDNVFKIADKQKIEAKDLSKYPLVKRDLSLLLDSSVTFDEIVKISRRSEKKLLLDVALFDVYEGKNLPEGKKSYAVSFFLQDESKTMSDKQIDAIMQKIQRNLQQQLSAELR